MKGIKRTASIVAVIVVVVLALAGTALANGGFTPVDIDIKPGSCPNSINVDSHGVVPVAVLSTDVFDATTVDPPTVRFAEAAPLRWAMYDVDGDGDVDLIMHFKTQELNLNESSTDALLTGRTFDGIPIEGMDSVRIVPVSI